MTAAEVASRPATQLLHLVFGGELKSLGDVDFADLERCDPHLTSCSARQGCDGGNGLSSGWTDL